MAIEEAETEIRRTVKNEYLKTTPKTAVDKKVKDIITATLKEIKIPALRDAARRSLINFYNRQYAEIRRLNGAVLAVYLALYKLTDETVTGAEKAKARTKLTNYGVDKANLYGSAMQKYSKDYIEKNVQPVFDRLAKQFPIDPDSKTSRVSLRNRAEMEVRYQGHLDEIAGFKAKGVKLVIASTHADCSERCARWQGKVYSLDGTSGTTDDGRTYQPLEVATDVYYTTKAGKTYKNGLLGFNCRHFLVEYKSGYRFPKPDAAEEKRQYKITETQRKLERAVIHWKTEAIESSDRERYLYCKKKAIKWNNAYIKYSKENGRAYYPSRTKIL